MVQATLAGGGRRGVAYFPRTVCQPQVPARDAQSVTDALENFKASSLPLTHLIFVDAPRAQAGCAREAAERGASVVLLIPEERAAEAIQAIEAANARREDKIPYESLALA